MLQLIFVNNCSKQRLSDEKKSANTLPVRKIVIPLHPLKRNNACQARQEIPQSNLQGAIAQLVEHRTENPCVTGSNPVGTTSSFNTNPACFS